MWGGRRTFFIPCLLSSAAACTAGAASAFVQQPSQITSPLPAFISTRPPPACLYRCGPTTTTTTTIARTSRLAFASASVASLSPSFLHRSNPTSTIQRHMTASSSTTTDPPPPLKTKLLTLLFVRRSNPTTGVKEVLLGMKKRGFGLGKWNGFGGKVEPGETIEAAALRELEEESCVKASAVELRGKITFTFLTIPEVLKVHVFEAVGPMEGEPQETEEMMPQWYAESEIPFEKMWADDKYWVPLFLEGKRFKALFEFDDESTILRYDLDTVEEGEEL